MSGHVAALVGGQFGSEGKGLVASEIAQDYHVHVRVGAANAGHTLYTQHPTWHETGDVKKPWYEKHVMQQLPCAAYANPDAYLVIGPGALISPDILAAEMERLAVWRSGRGLEPKQVFMDHRAQIVLDNHIQREQATDLAERIGSTSTIAKEGIGAAQAARVMREAGCEAAADYFLEHLADEVVLCDVPMMLYRARMAGQSILLEGTQGTGLSLTTGFFPYVTSRNTTAAGLAADCGVAPNVLERVILVCRTYPIRVAGPSGPFWLGSEEIKWRDIGINEEKERTTVTKKVRRVATFSMHQVHEAAILNGATEVALTFADYIEPEIAGMDKSMDDMYSDTLANNYPLTVDMMQRIEDATGLPVTMVGTGPHSVMRSSWTQSAAA